MAIRFVASKTPLAPLQRTMELLVLLMKSASPFRQTPATWKALPKLPFPHAKPGR